MALYDDRKYKDEDGVVSPFEGIEKGAVLQECRIFNDIQLKTQKCKDVLVRLLYLVGQGEKLTREEATTVFFSVTKLFQANDPSLRRLVYLAIKELAHTAEEVIIVTNCLTKDINSDVDMYRANATRVLCKITDAQMVQQIERYLKQELVDRNPVVSSAALVSGQQLLMHGRGDYVVRRWNNEVTQALQHRSPMVQYHALALLYQIKQNDRLAVIRLVQTMANSGTRSPLATVLLIRYVARIMVEAGAPQPGEPRPMFEFLDSCLRHTRDAVVYEAAKTIVHLPGVTPVEIQPVVNVLQLFLVQPKTVSRFAAMRTLNEIAQIHPLAIMPCHADIEGLIGDTNRSIATMAITALLRTGSEASIDRLLKQIQTFLSDIADEFKVKVVDAIRTLCMKFPSKHYVLMNFLGGALREEGGYEFKKAIVDAYLELMERIPDSKEACLGHLCEFIEDCEHTALSTRILHLLGKEGPKISNPGKFIRYIYNRLILENATVRAAAVSALASFAGENATAELRKSVAILLRQSLVDNDDEVRDRAAYALRSLGLDHPEDEEHARELASKAAVNSTLPCPVSNLELELLRYVANGDKSKSFSISNVPKVLIGGHSEEEVTLGKTDVGGRQKAAPSAKKAEPVQVDPAANVLANSELAEYGRPLQSNRPVELTEEETEYTVKCIKHMYSDVVVLEFVIVNTVNEQLLEDVHVRVDISEMEGVSNVRFISAPELPYDTPGTAFTVLERIPEEFPLGTMACTMLYTSRDVDPATGEAGDQGIPDEEYKIEEVTIGLSDLMSGPAQLPSSFRSAWESLGDEFEVGDSFTLGNHSSVGSAVSAVVAFMGMSPCEGTERVSDRASSHVLLMAGVFVPNVDVLCRAEVSLTSGGVALNVIIRSQDMAISELVASSIA
mmetsp:Transcript_420/g.1432  ORF Transcript_420/g.1432 Transcript_420/m.1432 type:complete len:900 (+) Transcript_420:85-2784(+)